MSRTFMRSWLDTSAKSMATFTPSFWKGILYVTSRACANRRCTSEPFFIMDFAFRSNWVGPCAWIRPSRAATNDRIRPACAASMPMLARSSSVVSSRSSTN
eukprot:scaffold31533_cov44-Phaeocystis_antarctica.AAC.3